jgi:hypothetical protein
MLKMSMERENFRYCLPLFHVIIICTTGNQHRLCLRGQNMVGLLKEMKKKKIGIPDKTLAIFEDILHKHVDAQGRLNLSGID